MAAVAFLFEDRLQGLRIAAALVFIPQAQFHLALTVKRLCDRNRTGWWVLTAVALAAANALFSDTSPPAVAFVVVALSVVVLWWNLELVFFLPSMDEENAFGERQPIRKADQRHC